MSWIVWVLIFKTTAEMVWEMKKDDKNNAKVLSLRN